MNRDAYWAAQAKLYAQQAPVASGTGGSLSCKGGVFAIGKEQLGTRLVAVVLDNVWLNTYFDTKWEDGKPTSPRCYAYGRQQSDMVPHESMRNHMEYFYPQTLDRATGQIGACSTCKWNEYGTGNTGRGKACQNREKLVVIPAGRFVQKGYSYDLELERSTKWFQEQPSVNFSLPVTSVAGWRKYVQSVAATTGRPPFAVITVMECAPHPKWQTEVKFTMVEAIPQELEEVIIARHMEARGRIIDPFSPPEEQPPTNADVR